MKKIAIAGAGLAGLSVAWHLLQLAPFDVTLFDPSGIGGGASGISTGLLHPFPGKLALPSWRWDEGMKATGDLVRKVEEDSSHPVSERRGILRLALTKEQEHHFQKCLPFGCQWWPEEKVSDLMPSAAKAPALWIPEGMTVYSMPYLQGLWQLCQKKGAVLKKEAFCKEEGFDATILAMGWKTLEQTHSQENLKVNRGQALFCRSSQSLTYPLLSQGHLTTSETPGHFQLGSTYENPDDPLDSARALALKEKIALFYPPARDFEVVETRVGYRIARHLGYRPIVSQVDAKTWAFFGLGSRGLLYHALLGSSLAQEIFDKTSA